MSDYKEDIVNLREQGKTYNQIRRELGCSLSTISYHCKKEDLEDIGLKNEEISDEKKKEIKEYYQTHTGEETADKFDVCLSTVKKYTKDVNKQNEDKGSRELGSSETYFKGDFSELKVELALLERGYIVSRPVNSSTRYDLIVDTGSKIHRVQVKTGRDLTGEKIRFPCKSNSRSNGYKNTHIDVFCVYFEKFDDVYWVPVEEANSSAMILRYGETKNNQDKSVNWYEDYLL